MLKLVCQTFCIACVCVGVVCGVWTPPIASAETATSRQAVQVRIFEGQLPFDWTKRDAADLTETANFPQSTLALASLPHKYNAKGLRIDRSAVFVVRIEGKVELQAGVHKLLLRSMNGARVKFDGRELARTRFIPANSDGHEEVPDIPQAQVDGMRRLPVGHAEVSFTVESDGGWHDVQIEAFVGGKKLRPELGELSLSRLGTDGRYHVIANEPSSSFPLEDVAWETFAKEQRQRALASDRKRRIAQSEDERAYWAGRHKVVREWLQSQAAATPSSSYDVLGDPERSVQYLNSIVHKARVAAEAGRLEPLDDLAMLRRQALDTVGRLPTADEVAIYRSHASSERQTWAEEHFLNDRGWADHWVAYWQDVLAENPGILKPKINNTGPFRYWIHESFVDNKPLDRFVTELVMMEGSKYYGGPAGFAMASQNDVPMGAKAQIIGQAFMGVEMKCARCHDAPFQAVRQQDLFELAAMLARKPQPVPATSSIPLPDEELEQLAVTVSLKPGTDVQPRWPFQLGEAADAQPGDATGDLVEGHDRTAASFMGFPEGWLRNPEDTREQLAAHVTDYRQRRFARVMANRLWHRYFGVGLVESIEHWEEDIATGAGVEVLDHLANELMYHGYDVKHVARLIFRTELYAATVSSRSGAATKRVAKPFRPGRRRMSAEQIVDSLFVVSGRAIESEPLTLDLDGRRPASSFLNFGKPERAWEFTSLSNERDRPALAMPQAQSIVDVLETFGWRASRQNPVTERSQEATVQQPAILANGLITRRIATLSDDNALTELCLEAKNIEQLIHELSLRMLTREAKPAELELFGQVLADGFETRQTSAKRHADSRTKPHAVSWSNHLNAEATRIKLEMERWVREGDPPTQRIHARWREAAEDVIWAMLNSPEFVFVP